ncbi:MAG: SdpI family protein [Clostridiales bacterium]|nr:SdpI family protein [Clostridiales bacterium]
MKFAFFILPVILIVAGIILHITSAVKINSIYGFRTKTSSKNEHTWKYCNKLCAKILIVVGVAAVIAICVTAKATMLVLGLFSIGEIVNILAISAVLLSIPLVNYSCKKKFSELFHNN